MGFVGLVSFRPSGKIDASLRGILSGERSEDEMHGLAQRGERLERIAVAMVAHRPETLDLLTRDVDETVTRRAAGNRFTSAESLVSLAGSTRDELTRSWIFIHGNTPAELRLQLAEQGVKPVDLGHIRKLCMDACRT